MAYGRTDDVKTISLQLRQGIIKLHIWAIIKNFKFYRSNSNFSILAPTFSRDGFYDSYFLNPSENSVIAFLYFREFYSVKPVQILKGHSCKEKQRS